MTTTTRQYRNTPVDVKQMLSALWIAMLFVFAYVDIFSFYRADVLNAAMEGKVATTALAVNQTSLTASLVYVLVATLMVVLSLALKPRINRITNIAVSLLYTVTIIVSCVGETWVYYLLGSSIEVILLIAIARTAWQWPAGNATQLPQATTGIADFVKSRLSECRRTSMRVCRGNVRVRGLGMLIGLAGPARVLDR